MSFFGGFGFFCRWFLLARRMSHPLFAAVKEWGGVIWRKLLAARENLTHASPERSGGGADIAELFSQAAAAEKNDDAEAAEQCYIRIISLDSKNAAAFKMLGQFYFAQGKLAEARETLEHVLKLTREDSEIYAKIAEVAAKQADNDKAREYYQKSIKLNSENAQTHFHLAELNRQTGSYKDALDNLRAALLIEPKNPRYLDGLFAVSILVKDKVQALDAYKDLKGINPENAKLEEMKKQIDDL